MKRYFQVFCFYGLILSCIFLSACKKDFKSEIGSNLQPEDEILKAHLDSVLIVEAFSSLSDSLLMQDLTMFLLGSSYDADMGIQTADFCARVEEYITEEPTIIPDRYRIDSVVFQLEYSGKHPTSKDYFNEQIPISLDFYELAAPLNSDSTDYYSNHKVEYKQNAIAQNIQIFPRPFDSLITDSITKNKKPKPLKEYLPKSIGEYFIKAARYAQEESKNFEEVFNGLYIKTQNSALSEGGNYVSFFTEAKNGTTLSIYFYNYTIEEQDVITFRFNTPFFSAVNHDYTNASESFKKQVLEKDSSLGKDFLYLQPFAGTQVHFKVPNIRSLDKKRVILNQACIVLSNARINNYASTPPASLKLFVRNANGNFEDIIDIYTTGAGAYNKANGEYRIYLTRHLQKILTNESLENVYITVDATDRYSSPAQISFFGTDPRHGNKRARLELIYTKID